MDDIVEKVEGLIVRVFDLEKKHEIIEERQKNSNKVVENLEKDLKEFTHKTFTDFQQEQRENNKQTNKILFMGMGILLTVQVLVVPLFFIFIKG